MSRGKHRDESRAKVSQSQSRTAVVVIVVLAITLVVLVLGPMGRLLPIEHGALQLFSPVQYALTRLVDSVGGLRGWIRGMGRLQAENEELRQQVDALRTQVEILREAQVENEVLRAQLGFAQAHPSYEVLPAEVIGADPSNLVSSLIVDRGSDEEVVRGMPVITARGLVGRIVEVHKTSSLVLLLTDASSSVSALVQRTRSTGMVQGRMGRNPIMRYIPQGEPVAVGDVILTSGLGGNFPKRLVIGYVTSVTGEDVDLFQEAEVRPAVHLGGMEMVMLLLDFSSGDFGDTDGLP